MSLATFPTNINFKNITRIPNFSTQIVGFGGAVEQRICWDPYGWFEIVCQLGVQDDIAATAILAFFKARKGAYEAFYFQNPEEAWGDLIWTPGTLYAIDEWVRPTVATGRSYRCTDSGVSHATNEPTWPTGVNGTVTDNPGADQITWTENTYTVRFKEDTVNFNYFLYRLYDLGDVSFLQRTA